jgi:hypothetical protein
MAVVSVTCLNAEAEAVIVTKAECVYAASPDHAKSVCEVVRELLELRGELHAELEEAHLV